MSRVDRKIWTERGGPENVSLDEMILVEPDEN